MLFEASCVRSQRMPTPHVADGETTVMDVFAADTLLRSEAADLLAHSGLLACLARYGEVHLVGSYVLELMAWRDLDLEVVADDLAVATWFALGADVADCLNPVRMQFRNERRARTSGLPHGLYWGVYLGSELMAAWKLDIWAVTAAHHQASMAQMQTVRQRLTPQRRRTILELKTHYYSDGRYRRAITSQDLYRAVLEHDVSTVDHFERFLLAQPNA